MNKHGEYDHKKMIETDVYEGEPPIYRCPECTCSIADNEDDAIKFLNNK